MPFPIRGETFASKERNPDGTNILRTIVKVVGEPGVPQDTGGTFLVFAHFHRPIHEHETEHGSVKGLEQARFAIHWNAALLRWEENL